ncbi:hypothetical protein KEG38_52410 [Polyangium jinanense]|uniref:hypothetical protein n=1 Tax=Polyangium jinanense TaxID=2829994 RepID=UPI00234172CB|nr:hypothetical protein [Polyangium jinanense]MDC3962528.1 hypothetical protein [Polyangium jinanense]
MLGMTLAGCEDKAEADFKRGQEFEQKGEIEAASNAYADATNRDSVSFSGRAARDRIEALKPKIEELREKRKQAIKEAEAKAAASAAPPAPPAPTIRYARYSEIDDICSSELKQGYKFSGSGLTIGDVKKAFPSCMHLADDKFCCGRLP